MANYWWEDENEVAKLAASGANTSQIEAIIKEAARQKELQEVYADFDAAGRIMARGFYDEFKKVAAIAAMDKQEAKLSESVEEVRFDKDAALKELISGK